MARVPLIQTPTGPLIDLYAEAAGRLGAIPNLYKAIANQPAALRAHLELSRHVRKDSLVPPKIRELAILATGYALGSDYEAYQHTIAARGVGVEEEKLAAFPDWASSDVFSVEELEVLRFADQLARTRTVDDATYRAIADRYGDAYAVDLTVTCGFYHYCAAVLGALRIELEKDLPNS